MGPEELKALLNKLQNDPDCRFDVEYYDKCNPDPYEWKLLLQGTKDTPYEGGLFMLKIKIPTNYPDSKPIFYFLTKIFHPHVEQGSGHCCYCPPSNDILDCMDCVENMFEQTDPEHGYSQEPAKYYSRGKPEFEAKAKEWTKEFANEDRYDEKQY